MFIQAKEKPGSVVHADDPISFLQLSSSRGAGDLGGTENVFELSLNQAVVGGRRNGIGSGLGSGADAMPGSSKLNKVTQLTGFSDPVYAEAYVHVNQYDIVLDVLIVNQTGIRLLIISICNTKLWVYYCYILLILYILLYVMLLCQHVCRPCQVICFFQHYSCLSKVRYGHFPL